MNMDIALDYIRMVGYGVIILTSLNGILVKKFNNILFLGDILIAFTLLISGALRTIVGIDKNLVTDMILTPAVIIWAIIHFMNLLKYNKVEK
jgi:hypothetical protein